MNHYSCSLGGTCEPDDDEGHFPSRDACEAVCAYDPTTGITDLDYLIYQYDPVSATLLAPTDRVEVIKRFTESQERVQPQDSRQILSFLAGPNLLPLNIYPSLRDYVFRTLGEVAMIATTQYSSYLLLSSGLVYACGDNYSGQLGLGDTTYRNIFTPVPLLDHIHALAACDGLTYLLTDEGQVYETGTNHPLAMPRCNTFTLVPLPQPIQTMFNGDYTIWLLDVNGDLYGRGDNRDGRLGLGDTVNRPNFTRVSPPGPVQELVSDSFSSYLLDTRGKVYVCGDNRNGQLGLGYTDIVHNRFTLVPLAELIQKVVVGYQAVYLLTDSGQVYTCGLNTYGQFGLGDDNNRNIFTLVPLGETRVKTIITNNESTYLVGVDGQVYACGYNESGQLGLGNNNDRNSFALVQVPTVREIVVGSRVTYFLTDRGEVYACGANFHGELGLGLGYVESRNTPTQVPLAEPIQTISAKSTHVLMMGMSGRVYACGQNEYGQLGLGDTIDRNTFTLVFGNPVDEPVRVEV